MVHRNWANKAGEGRAINLGGVGVGIVLSHCRKSPHGSSGTSRVCLVGDVGHSSESRGLEQGLRQAAFVSQAWRRSKGKPTLERAFSWTRVKATSQILKRLLPIRPSYLALLQSVTPYQFLQ